MTVNNQSVPGTAWPILEQTVCRSFQFYEGYRLGRIDILLNVQFLENPVVDKVHLEMEMHPKDVCISAEG